MGNHSAGGKPNNAWSSIEEFFLIQEILLFCKYFENLQRTTFPAVAAGRKSITKSNTCYLSVLPANTW